MSELCLGVSGWGLVVSVDVLIPNLLVKMHKSHASSDIAFSSSALYCIKMPMAELCLEVYEWSLRVSGDELIQNMLAQIYIGHVSSDIAFYSNAR